MSKFISYCAGSPLVSIDYSYDETTMTKKAGRKSKTVSITEEQHRKLDRMPADDWNGAAAMFREAGGTL